MTKLANYAGSAGDLVGTMDCAELTDLGLNDSRFAGVLAPPGEIDMNDAGVTRQFLEDAETYHSKYFDIGYAKHLIGGALEAIEIDGRVDRILDIGSGSGPSVLALLSIFNDTSIVATDVSPNLLAVLRRALDASDQGQHCATVCLDLNKPWFKNDTFDLAVGSAILHHLFEPQRLIAEVFAAVRPGGAAIFFEPFEPGYAVMAMIYRLLLAHAQGDKQLRPVVETFFRGKIAETAMMKCEPKDAGIYATVDDKWMFTRGYVVDVGHRIGASRTVVYPINHSDKPFTNQMKVMLRLGLGLEPDALASWAWDLITDFEASVSDNFKREVFLEGCIAFVK